MQDTPDTPSFFHRNKKDDSSAWQVDASSAGWLTAYSKSSDVPARAAAAPAKSSEPPAKIAAAGESKPESNSKRVLIPTFSMGDPDIDEKHQPNKVYFDANSPEATLYKKNAETVVKITVDGRGSGGKPVSRCGTGFFVTQSGDIATANHVVEGATAIHVTTVYGVTYNATLKAHHETSEAALIHITDAAAGEHFPAATLRGTASDFLKGEKMTVLGHPKGVDEVVMSPGTFVSRERLSATVIQWASISPNTMLIHARTRVQGGNSGGPIFDSEGRVAGITNFRNSDGSGEFLGIDEIRSLINDPKYGQLSDRRSFVLPSTLQLDYQSAWRSFNPLLSAAGGFNAYVAAKYRYPLPSVVTTKLTALVAGGIGIRDMVADYDAMRFAWQKGSSAERISAGIDLGGDALTVCGSLLSIASKRYALAGMAIAGIGSSSRFLNSLLSDRRYY